MADDAESFRSPLGRVRGLGAAKEGVAHWWAQRLTAVALVPLGLWLVASVIHLAGAEHAAVQAWLRAPVPLGLMILLVAVAFRHLQLGLQVIIEDYVRPEGARLALIVATQIGCLVLGLASILALLFIALRS
ncbi:MAG: succinate dehydrogenase, hydrophobic membrane anchor protein [Rhodospirillaceae bacterium]|nr:succinate dehydrogenase, hydrophobic membrane anchor protein [Rhodospirillaceae bacterium]